MRASFTTTIKFCLASLLGPALWTESHSGSGILRGCHKMDDGVEMVSSFDK